jgi:hypothetical protein
VSTPFYQPLDPAAPPPPVTPADSPGDAAGFAMVTPHGRGPAPYDIQAPSDEAAVQAAYDGAGAVSAAGVSAYHHIGTRQAEARQLLESPSGFSAGGGTSGYDITAGWSGEPGESWDNNPQPGTLLETPIQGQTGTYPAENTYQPGLRKYGTS